MAKQFHELTYSATDFAADDFIAVDGATNKTRKMSKDDLLAKTAENALASIKNLPTSITAFRTGDVIAVDGPSGTAKMSKDALLQETAQNALSAMLKSIDLNETKYWFIGGIITSSGKYEPNYADRLVTDFIKIEKYQTITFTRPAGVSFYYNVYCYDSDYNYLGYVATLNASIMYSTYPSTCFIRLGLTSISGASVAVSNLANIVVFSANILCYDIASEGEIKKVENDISSLDYKTDHLFDDSSVALDLNDTQYWQNGGIDSSTGTEAGYADRLRTIFLMLTSTSTISYNKKTGVDFSRTLYCYDKNKTYLGYSSTTSIATALTTYPTAVWFRISLTSITGATVDYTNISNIFTWRAGLFEVVEGYESRLRNLEDLTGGFAYKDPLKGKKWYACGDSFTAGATAGTISENGPYKGYKCVYPYFIGNRTAMDVHNIAVSGSTMTYKNGVSTASNCFSYPSTGKYLSIPADADYITLKFGINDDPSHEDMPLGTIDDATNETLYGAWNVVISYLITNCPHAKIGIIVTNGCYDSDYSKAARDIAEKWGLGYLDENFDYKVPLLIRVTGKPNVSSAAHNAVLSKMRVSESNTHPNDWAHEYESTIVEAWLRTL